MKKSFIPLLLFAGLTLAAYVYLTTRNSPGIIDSLETPPGDFISHGIDVSHHQGIIDWEEYSLSMDTINTFVYCKATEGVSFVDNQWKQNRKELLRLEMTHGAYHFFQPLQSATKQADHFLEHYSPKQTDLPPVLDLETENGSRSDLIKSVKAWLLRIESITGRRPIIYTSYNMYTEWVKDNFSNYNFWIANYGDKFERFEDSMIIHWQYSETGKLPGINGLVDLNYSKIQF